MTTAPSIISKSDDSALNFVRDFKECIHEPDSIQGIPTFCDKLIQDSTIDVGDNKVNFESDHGFNFDKSSSEDESFLTPKHEKDVEEESMLAYQMHRRDYYSSKLGFSIDSPAELESHLFPLVRGYVFMLQWILDYYYLTVVDWGFFYAYHYAPFASDFLLFIDRLADSIASPSSDSIQESRTWISFSADSQPVLPFELQFHIFPSASAYVLPGPLRSLLSDPESPLASYYPTEYQRDMNGKIAPWEAVIVSLIMFRSFVYWNKCIC
ncbi:unnamed protein product [Protopolystoma xenopodis]|uniref:Xrn1 helical domain-containing protein n=1 Tax=Protopolystoma xenopodis TaxID=117903 RepID=A0A3S5AYT6_9PLAT|nr:unnamed protein product [Protopolystoma xenopodis]